MGADYLLPMDEGPSPHELGGPMSSALSRRTFNMPTYDFACRKCGHEFQKIQKISEHGTKKLRCPKCKSQKVEQVFTSVFVKTSKKS
jgi:putative FmdB family regulatory protein